MRINRYSAIEVLRKDGIVIFPTDTVYGIGCICNIEQAIDRIYNLKNRDRRKPLILFISDLKQVEDIAYDIQPIARKLMNKFWPGPLTIILRAKENIPISKACIFKTDKFNTVSFRIPNHPIPRFLVEELGVPIATTSANISGYNEQSLSLNKLSDMFENEVDILVDDNETKPEGIESTIVNAASFPLTIIREGAIGDEVRRYLNLHSMSLCR